jgi:hypothetical protein
MGSTTTTKKNGSSLMFRIKSIPVGIALLTLCAPNLSTRAADLNDYSTSARVDYVFGCMKANGETQVSLQKCSCSIDVIASLLPYDRYVTAQTVLSMSQVPGNLGAEFRTTEISRTALEDLRRAQAEAEVRCF